MTPEEKKELKGHINAIANILYKQTKPEQLETLSKIEETVRKQTLEYTAVCSQIEDNKESQKEVNNEAVFLGLARAGCQRD